MKIKCPYCEEEFTYYRDMQKHFVRLDHKTLPAMKYAELIFKIHEKIALYESMANGDYEELDKIKANTRAIALKSLLENK